MFACCEGAIVSVFTSSSRLQISFSDRLKITSCSSGFRRVADRGDGRLECPKTILSQSGFRVVPELFSECNPELYRVVYNNREGEGTKIPHAVWLGQKTKIIQSHSQERVEGGSELRRLVPEVMTVTTAQHSLP